MPKRVDANHGEIRDAGRQIPGTHTHDTHDLGHGFPDLLHASRYGATIIGNVPLDEIQRRLKGLPALVLKGFNLPVEVKTETGKLTKDERDWFVRWPGPAVVVRSPDEMLNWTGAVEVTQPCGHPLSAIVSGDEGTSYCGECEGVDKSGEV